MAPDRQTAEVRLAASARLKAAGQGDRVRRLFNVDWIKEEGEWLIMRVEPFEPIQKPSM